MATVFNGESLNMDKAKFREIVSEYSTTFLDGSDLSNAFWVVYDILRAEADALKEKEPYATNSIRALEDAAHQVFMMESDIWDAYDEAMSD